MTNIITLTTPKRIQEIDDADLKASPNPRSYLTEEQRQQIMKEGGLEFLYSCESDAADDAGDDEAGWQWLAKAELPAHALKLLKKWRGAQFIRQLEFNTTEADLKYGKDWLDKDI